MHDDQKQREALNLMVSALALLDETDAAHEVGAHLDLAICLLKNCTESITPKQDTQTGTSATKKR